MDSMGAGGHNDEDDRSGKASHHHRYEEFYAEWTQRQEELIKELQEALDSDMKEGELGEVVKRVEQHYDCYYDVIEDASRHNILQVMTPSWRSPLEKAFLWLGEWRPSVAFQLVYALAGQQVEAELAEFLDGIDSPTLASLTSAQLTQISSLQTRTNKEEESLGEHVALLQQSIADQPLLYLAYADQVLVEQNGADEAEDDDDDGGAENEDQQHKETDQQQGSGSSTSALSVSSCDDGLHIAIKEKLKTLVQLSLQADSLRRRTLKNILSVLTTVQRAQYLLASAQLQMSLRTIGQRMNSDRGSMASPFSSL